MAKKFLDYTGLQALVQYTTEAVSAAVEPKADAAAIVATTEQNVPLPDAGTLLRIIASGDGLTLNAVLAAGQIVYRNPDWPVTVITTRTGYSGTETTSVNGKSYAMAAGETLTLPPAAFTSIKLNGNVASVKLAGKAYASMMAHRFTNGQYITSVDLTALDTSACTSFIRMLNCCKALTSVGDLSALNTANVTEMEGLFNMCTKLAALDLHGWSLERAWNLYCLFQNCYALASLNIAGWDFSHATNLANMFNGCSALTSITGPVSGIGASISLAQSPLDNASAMVIINGLAQTADALTVTFKASTYAELSAEQIAVATAKGWTVASA